MRNKKILFLINGLGYGGAETQLVRLSESLITKGKDIVLITLTNDLSLEEELHPKVKHYNIQLKGISDFKSIKEILNVVKYENPKVIHSHLFQANIIGRIVKVFNSKIRVVNTTHGVQEPQRIAGLSPYFIYKISQKWVDYHTAVSEESLKLLRDENSVNKLKSCVMLNGLFVDRYDFSHNDKKIFKWLSVGRLIPVKNYKLLISACEILVKENMKFKLDIIGDGFEKGILTNLIKEKQLERNVTLLGISKDIPKILKCYDAFVISSNSEGLPMVLLEAMSAKLPIVSTNVGGIPAVINNSKGGVIVESRNEMKLASAMQSFIMKSEDDLNKMGNNNYMYVKNKFNIDKISNQWLEIYNK